eukprot:3841709-Rhodomonas_salina.4
MPIAQSHCVQHATIGRDSALFGRQPFCTLPRPASLQEDGSLGLRRDPRVTVVHVISLPCSPSLSSPYRPCPFRPSPSRPCPWPPCPSCPSPLSSSSHPARTRVSSQNQLPRLSTHLTH